MAGLPFLVGHELLEGEAFACQCPLDVVANRRKRLLADDLAHQPTLEILAAAGKPLLVELVQEAVPEFPLVDIHVGDEHRQRVGEQLELPLPLIQFPLDPGPFLGLEVCLRDIVAIDEDTRHAPSDSTTG
jgi:hypothetical protein